jgi:hypothetical protein
VLAVTIPSNLSLPLTAYPTRANHLKFSNIVAGENTSFPCPPNDLMVGTSWTYNTLLWEQYFTNYETALYFNVNSQISGKTIKKAELRLYVKGWAQYRMTNQYRIAAWAESWNSNITYNTKPKNYYTHGVQYKTPPGPEAATDARWFVDVTAIVQNWANGTPNHGFWISDNHFIFPYATYSAVAEFWSTTHPTFGDLRPSLYIEFQ